MGKASSDPATPPTLSKATIARLDAMTPERIEQNAIDDLDNPPMNAAELDAVRIARLVQSVRKSRGLSQTAFALAYRFSPARLRDWEQGRRRPDPAALAYLEIIRREPEAVARALNEVGRQA